MGHVMPAVLMGVSVSTAVSALLEIQIQRIEVQDNLFSIVHIPTFQSLSHFLDTDILAEALGLAFIASVETLLSASAVDQLHTGPRTRYNRELFAQGVGNMPSRPRGKGMTRLPSAIFKMADSTKRDRRWTFRCWV